MRKKIIFNIYLLKENKIMNCQHEEQWLLICCSGILYLNEAFEDGEFFFAKDDLSPKV